MNDHNKRTDEMLWALLQECKTITNFFDAIFGFLQRNTDYYYVQKYPEEKVGFPVGCKERILLNSLQRYDYKLTELPDANELGCDMKGASIVVPEVAEEVELSDYQQDMTIDSNIDNLEMENPPEAMYLKTTRIGVPGLNFQAFEYKNGSIFENYCWSQTLTELELYVLVSSQVNSCKDIALMTRPSSITVMVEDRILLSGEVWSKYKYNNVIWTLVDGKIQISIDKAAAKWWDKLFIHEPVVNCSEIDTEQYADEMPSETKAALDKFRKEQMDLNELKMEAELDMTKKCSLNEKDDSTANNLDRQL